MSEPSSIRIAGAGIAGLTAAIRLARSGVPVEVHERRRRIGGRFLGDLQGLENWTTEQDVLDELHAMGIERNFDCDPLPPLTTSDGQRRYQPRSKRPLCHLVKRGPLQGSLDRGLLQQAERAGARVITGSRIAPEEAHICATGPRAREVFAIAKGWSFQTDLPDMALAIVNDEAAVAGYSYLLVVGGYGCLCTTLFDRFDRAEACLQATRARMEALVGLRMHNPRKVGGLGGFSAAPTFRLGRALCVGEAAGLQDLLWGFGIRTAMQSGELAARCLLEGLDYPALAQARFGGKLKASVVNRFLYAQIGRRVGYRPLLIATGRSRDPLPFLSRAHRFTRIHRALYPIAQRAERRRLERLNRRTPELGLHTSEVSA